MADRKNLKDAIYRAVIMQAEGKDAESEAALRRVLAESPNEPDALHFLGLAEYRKGRGDDAAKLVARAVAADRSNAQYAESLGKILLAQGHGDEAEKAFRDAVRLAPERDGAQLGLADLLRARGANAEAEAVYRRLVARDPKLAAAGNGLGIVLEEQGRAEEAEAVYRRTLESAGEAPNVLFNLGNVLRDQHRAAEAADAYRRAIAAKPDFAEAHVHLAYALLMQGDYRPAWKEYEWRWRVRAFVGSGRQYAQRMWGGDALNGRTLLLWAEQGFGDTLQFARYAGVAADTGGKVILECRPQLVRLMASAAGVGKAVAHGDKLPKFDVYAPLLSLPGLLGTTLETVPGNVPYLAAEPALIRKWRKRFKDAPGLKVGIAWRGTAERRGGPARACPLSALKPLIDDRRLSLFSLQKELAAEDKPLPDGVVDLSRQLSDFAETAAAISALDLVITIDTAVAHLSGGLGRPTMVMLSTACDWRWLSDGDATPWYPGARLFRQTRPGDWRGVVGKVAAAVAKMSAGRPPAAPRKRRRKTAGKA